MNGSFAQEGNLAMCSNLYLTQLKHPTYYNKNRRVAVDACYTDYMIYSDNVMFIRDGEYFREPVLASVLTAPAVNMGSLSST